MLTATHITHTKKEHFSWNTYTAYNEESKLKTRILVNCMYKIRLLKVILIDKWEGTAPCSYIVYPAAWAWHSYWKQAQEDIRELILAPLEKKRTVWLYTWVKTILMCHMVLGSILFNVYMLDLTVPDIGNITLYTDNATIYIRSKVEKLLFTKMRFYQKQNRSIRTGD